MLIQMLNIDSNIDSIYLIQMLILLLILIFPMFLNSQCSLPYNPLFSNCTLNISVPRQQIQRIRLINSNEIFPLSLSDALPASGRWWAVEAKAMGGMGWSGGRGWAWPSLLNFAPRLATLEGFSPNFCLLGFG